MTPPAPPTPTSPPTRPRILIAGIGNIFFGDDAFGVEVAQRLLLRTLPADVRVIDFGIRGIDLTYALLDGYEVAILVDAIQRGGQPGTLYVIEPDTNPQPEPEAADLMILAHDMHPAKVLRLVAAMGGRVERILLVACEAATSAAEEDMQMELSPPVRAAVDEAVKLIESMIGKILAGESPAESHCHDRDYIHR